MFLKLCLKVTLSCIYYTTLSAFKMQNAIRHLFILNRNLSQFPPFNCVLGTFWLISSSRWLISFTHTFALSLYTVVLRCTYALMKKKWLHSYQDQDFFIEFLGYIRVSPLNPHVFSFYMSRTFWTLQIDLVRGPSKTIGTWPKLFGDSPKLFWYHVDSRSKMKILHTYSINYRFLFWPHFVTSSNISKYLLLV